MNRKIQILALAALLMGAPLCTFAEADYDPDSELSAVTLTVKGSSVHVTNADGMTLEVYNLAGVKIKSIGIDSNDKTINFNLQRGYYIVKVGKIARKISIR